MIVAIRLSDSERDLVARYAYRHGLTMEDAFKAALFERIEDEYDAAVAEDAMRDYLDSGCESYPIEEIWAECKL